MARYHSKNDVKLLKLENKRFRKNLKKIQKYIRRIQVPIDQNSSSESSISLNHSIVRYKRHQNQNNFMNFDDFIVKCQKCNQHIKTYDSLLLHKRQCNIRVNPGKRPFSSTKIHSAHRSITSEYENDLSSISASCNSDSMDNYFSAESTNSNERQRYSLGSTGSTEYESASETPNDVDDVMIEHRNMQYNDPYWLITNYSFNSLQEMRDEMSPLKQFSTMINTCFPSTNHSNIRNAAINQATLFGLPFNRSAATRSNNENFYQSYLMDLPAPNETNRSSAFHNLQSSDIERKIYFF